MSERLKWTVVVQVLLSFCGAILAESPPSVVSGGSPLPSIEQCSAEIRLRITDELPYARFLLAIVNECDRRYETNPGNDWLKHIYWGLVNLLRQQLLCCATDTKVGTQIQPFIMNLVVDQCLTWDPIT